MFPSVNCTHPLYNFISWEYANKQDIVVLRQTQSQSDDHRIESMHRLLPLICTNIALIFTVISDKYYFV